MRIGIVCDDWKLAVFRKRLTEAGYAYADGGAPVPNCTNLIVVVPDTVDDTAALKKVVEACQAECARMKR